MHHSIFLLLRSSWDSEEEEDRKGRGCMLQYQHALVRVLTPFLADADDPAAGTAASLPAYFLGPEWQVDVTRLVQDSMRVGDPSVARLQSDTVLAGRAVGVTSVQVGGRTNSMCVCLCVCVCVCVCVKLL